MLKALLVFALAYGAAALAANLAADSMIFPAPPSSYGPGQEIRMLPVPGGRAGGGLLAARPRTRVRIPRSSSTATAMPRTWAGFCPGCTTCAAGATRCWPTTTPATA